MPKIRKRVWLIAIILGVVGASLNYVRLFYFPWENGYKVHTDQRLGYQYAKSNKISSAEKCNLQYFSKEYQEGCISFFE